MSAQLEAAVLAEVLKELRDSIREQNVLLKTFIAQHGNSSNLVEEMRQEPSKSIDIYDSTKSPSADDNTHIPLKGKQSSAPGSPIVAASDSGSHHSNQSESQDAETQLRRFAVSHQPLLKDRVAFYLASGPVPAELGGWHFCNIDTSLAKSITTREPQPRTPNPTGSWKFCESVQN